MASNRSGYVVDVPLGLWSTVEFAFIEDADGSGDIHFAEVHLADESGVWDLPNTLREFAVSYMKTWLTVVQREGEGLSFVPAGWVDGGFWQEQTRNRLEALVEEGLARKGVDLD